jgi:hypothetical protein
VTDEPDEPEERVEVQTITLSTPILGMSPYTLIEMREASDGSGEPSLYVDAGGGVEGDPLALPLLVVTECAPEKSAVAAMLRQVYRETGPTSTGASTVERIVREFNPDWIPFVTAD